MFKWNIFFLVFLLLCSLTAANPDAKRLYDDLLSNYNRLIRPVSNNTETILVKLGLRLSQLIDLVSWIFNLFDMIFFYLSSIEFKSLWFDQYVLG